GLQMHGKGGHGKGGHGEAVAGCDLGGNRRARTGALAGLGHGKGGTARPLRAVIWVETAVPNGLGGARRDRCGL
ncbi:hypothetical protein LSAC_00440, partial [Levilinea saccharolytica]